MMDIYRKLQKQLDQYSIGFPATESGVEIKILEKLFTEEHARMFLKLSMQLEGPEKVAKRTGRDPDATAALLAEMADRGLIFRHRKKDSVRYAASPFVVGSYEHQLATLDRELAELTEAYFKEAMFTSFTDSTVPLRTIPVNQSLDVSWPVAPYDDARAIIRGHETISVAKCICRVQQDLLEEACDKPMEVCLAFDSHADYYVENGMARYIDEAEALAVLDRAEEAGLVNQPYNEVNPGGMCNCCGDCCGVLRALNALPRPADMVTSSYIAVVDETLCGGCELCVDRCQLAAIALGPDNVSQVDLARCIGCGLCTTTCPDGALELRAKPEDERNPVPATALKLALRHAKERGTTLFPLFARDED